MPMRFPHKKLVRLIFLAAAFTPCVAITMPLINISQLVVFGDSLSDTGNAAYGTGGLLPGPLTNYAAGRFTDGPLTTPGTSGPQGNWIDQLAPKLGVADPGAGFTLLGGTNYAVGSALTGSNPQFGLPLQAPGVDQQVGAFLSSVGKVPSNALYVFWAGANDLTSGMSPQTALSNIYADIAGLAADGAKYFLWVNLPLVGEAPGAGASAAAFNAASAAFDAGWATDIAQLNQIQNTVVIGVDVELLFNQITANPAAYGFTDVKDAAQGNASANPNGYLFWDSTGHPTTTGFAQIANLAYNDIVAAPEPGEPLLTGLGLLVLAALLANRRRSAKIAKSRYHALDFRCLFAKTSSDRSVSWR